MSNLETESSKPMRRARPGKAGAARPRRLRRRLAIAGIVLAALIGLSWAMMSWAEHNGWKFFHRGREIIATLGAMDKALAPPRSSRTGTNRDAVGARVVVRSGNGRQVREVVLGDGYGSQKYPPPPLRPR